MALPQVAPQPHPQAGPFKFLDYFSDTEEDHGSFAGRDREVQDLLAQVATAKTVVLFAEPGVGKTSLLQAGVLPELRRRGFQTVYARTLRDPLADLEQALLAAGPPGGAGGNAGVEHLALAAAAGRPLVLALDQFEEFFILFAEKPQQRERFVAALRVLAGEPRLDLRIVFSLRQDYLAVLDEVRAALPPGATAEFRLRRLSAYGARQVIVAQLAAGRVDYDPAIVSRVVDYLEGSGFDPLLLQIYCSELYEAAVDRAAEGEEPHKAPRIEVLDLRSVGSFDQVFGRFLDRATSAIPEAQHLVVRLILNTLITYENTKRPISLHDLLAQPFATDEATLEPILDRLELEHIVRRQPRADGAWYELVHERIILRLQDWMNRDAGFRYFTQAQAMVHDNSKGTLWRDQPAALLQPGILGEWIEPWRDNFRFGEREIEYVFHSVLYCQSEHLAYWAERFGNGPALDLVAAWLGAADDRRRGAAAVAAGLLPAAWDRFRKDCRRLALDDPSAGVRQTAARAIARRGDDTDVAALAAGLTLPASRQRALDAIYQVERAGRVVHGLGMRLRRQARRNAERIAKKEHRDDLQRRRQFGAAFGATGGLMWALLVAPLLAFQVSAQISTSSSLADWGTDLMRGIALAVGLALPLGALVGWFSARAFGLDAILHGEGRWVRVAATGWPWIASALVLAAAGEAVGASCVSEVAFWPLAIVAAALLLVLLGAVQAQAHRDSLWPLRRSGKIVGWWWAAATGPPLAIGAALALPLRAVGTPVTTCLGVAALLSFACATMTSALIGAAARVPLGAEPPAHPRHGTIGRTLCLASFAAAVLLVDRRAVPLLAPPFTVDPDHGVKMPFSGEPSEHTDYRRLNNLLTRPQVVKIATMPPGSLGTFRIGTDTTPVPGEVLVLPSGCCLASLERTPSGPAYRGDVALVPLLRPRSSRQLRGEISGIVLAGDAPSLLRLALEPGVKNRTPTWRGAISGSVVGPIEEITVSILWHELITKLPEGLAGIDVSSSADGQSSTSHLGYLRSPSCELLNQRTVDGGTQWQIQPDAQNHQWQISFEAVSSRSKSLMEGQQNGWSPHVTVVLSPASPQASRETPLTTPGQR